MRSLGRFLSDEGHAPASASIFVGILCGIAVLLVAGIVIGAFGGAA